MLKKENECNFIVMADKNKTILIIQARLGSKGYLKILKKISGKSILEIIIDRIKKIETIDEFWIASKKIS